MEATRRTQLIKLIEAGDQRNEIQVTFNKLADIFNRYDIAQNEFEISDDTEQTAGRELFGNHYYQVESKFSELSYPLLVLPSRCN